MYMYTPPDTVHFYIHVHYTHAVGLHLVKSSKVNQTWSVQLTNVLCILTIRIHNWRECEEEVECECGAHGTEQLQEGEKEEMEKEQEDEKEEEQDERRERAWKHSAK